MAAHPSAYNVTITFGKYKGLSLGYIHDAHRGYLSWLSGADGIPNTWREAAARVLLKEDIEKLPLPNSSKSNYQPKATVTKKNKDTLRVKFDFDRELLNRFKLEIDGRKWDAEEKCWEIPAVQITKLVELFNGTKNIEADDATKKFWREEKKRREDLDEIRVKDDTDIKIPTKLPLFPYQRVAVEFADRAHGRAMVADQMGLGKTVVAIGFAAKKNYKVLVVCPKSTVVNWMREIKRFTGKNAVCWASEGRLGRSDAQYQVINYDIVGKHLKELNKMKFDLLVCDEATYLKNRTTKRSKNVLGYWKERKKYPGIKTKYCLFLTGTPVLNRPVEAYHLLNYLDKNRFNNFFHFTQKYGGWRGSEPQNLEELHERTKDLVIRRVKKDVLTELPDKQRNDLYVEMTKEDMREYNTHLSTLFRKWRQLGKPTVAEMPAIQQFLIQKKMPKAIEVIDELLEADRGVLVFSVYIEPLKQLLKHYGDDAAMVYGQMKGKERQESIDKLSTGRAKVGLFSIGAGSMGIDGIQKQIDTVIFLDQWWVPSVHEQAEDRVHRIGQNNKVQIFYMLCENTIDEYMRGILTEKQQVIDTVVDGKLITVARDKSFFKEFVQVLQQNYSKDMKKYEDVDDIEIEG
jgi:SNF2 family DNA or RNA helicase